MDLVSDCSTVLPVEIVLIIFYKYGGLQHPISSMIKEYVTHHFNEYRCFNCLYPGSYQSNCCWDGYHSLVYVDPSLMRSNPKFICNIKNHLLHSYQPKSILICYTCAHF